MKWILQQGRRQRIVFSLQRHGGELEYIMRNFTVTWNGMAGGYKNYGNETEAIIGTVWHCFRVTRLE